MADSTYMRTIGEEISPLITVVHPTARVGASEAFPRGWRDAHDAWLAACDNPATVEYIVAVHSSRWMDFMSSDLFGSVDCSQWGAFRVVENKNRDCVVDQTNAAAARSTGLVITGAADDYFPPEHWDTLILEALYAGDAELKESQVLLMSSGNPRDEELMIANAITRARLEQLGTLLDPDFESMFADNWFGFQNRRDAEKGVCMLIERPDIVFEHRHPVFGQGKMDAVYAQQNRAEAYRKGQVVFHQKVSGARVMVMCLPGENFRAELTGSRFQLIDDVKATTRYGLVAPHFCHTSNVYATRIELAKEALAFPSCTQDQDLILTVDDDNPLDIHQLQMLIEDLDARPDLAGVLGWCWCDHNEGDDPDASKWVMSCGRQDENLTCLRFTPQDFEEAAERGFLITSDDVKPHALWSGLPVMLIRRSAMEQMGWQAFVARTADPVLVGALQHALEALGGVRQVAPTIAGKAIRQVEAALNWAGKLNACRNAMTSEDTSFFIRAHELGLKFGIDVRVRVPHMKWRGIAPQYVPESERGRVEKLREVVPA